MADLKNTPCAPNDFFIIDCNRCYCNNERTGYVCAEKICPPVTTSNPIDVNKNLNSEISLTIERHNLTHTEEIRQKRHHAFEDKSLLQRRIQETNM